LKQRRPSLQAIAIEPAKSPVIAGGAPGPHRLQGLGAGFVPVNFDRSVVDEVIPVLEEDAGPVARQINQLDGIPVGISSGAIAWAALRVAKRPENAGKLIVAIMPSSTERYLSSWLFNDISVESDPIESLADLADAAK
jgi:cysteine synthase A